MKKNVRGPGVFSRICILFSRGRVSFLALSAAGHAVGLPVPHDARLDSGRAPWHGSSGRSKSREQTSFQATAFRVAELRRAMKPFFGVCYLLFSLCYSASVSHGRPSSRQLRYNSSRVASCSLCDSQPQTALLCVRVYVVRFCVNAS